MTAAPVERKEQVADDESATVQQVAEWDGQDEAGEVADLPCRCQPAQ